MAPTASTSSNESDTPVKAADTSAVAGANSSDCKTDSPSDAGDLVSESAHTGSTEEVVLPATQGFQATQPLELTQTQQYPPLKGHARLVSLTDESYYYDMEADEIIIGREKEKSHIHVDNKHISGRHVRIYRDSQKHYFVESLSSNGTYVNEQRLEKGHTRSLRNGDFVSLVRKFTASCPRSELFAAYVFQTAKQETPKQGADKDSFYAHYDVSQTLGNGNFSEVKACVHITGGEKRAVKIIDKQKFLQFQQKRASQLDILSEKIVLGQLNHPNIIKCFEKFETDTHLFLVMELLCGGDLLQHILDKGHFLESEARRLFQELCEGVQYIHQKDIVHRDMKPENILLTEKTDRAKLRFKIADFGLARHNYRTKDCKTFCGTPHYFAPEVIETFRNKEVGAWDKAGYGKQADLWSLGVILYIMLSGVPPFEDDDLYTQIVDGQYEFDVHEWKSVSDSAKDLVRKLMQVDPKKRLTIEQALAHEWFLDGPQKRPFPTPQTHKDDEERKKPRIETCPPPPPMESTK